MSRIRAHFDGKAIIPDEPIELDEGQPLIVHVEAVPPASSASNEPLLEWLARNPVEDATLPSDLTDEHDHYLYGTPRKS